MMFIALIILPPPINGEMILEDAIKKRRSVRKFSSDTLSLQEISNLLWAGQGITSKDGRRSAPSAGALYPITLYLANSKGVFRYIPQKNALKRIVDKDVRMELYSAALYQEWIRDAPVSIIISGNFSKTMKKYGERGIRYVWMESGHVAENILLESVSLNLGGVPVGAFNDDKIKAILRLPFGETPLYVIPIGKPLD